MKDLDFIQTKLQLYKMIKGLMPNSEVWILPLTTMFYGNVIGVDVEVFWEYF
jgi:hypothetical protein